MKKLIVLIITCSLVVGFSSNLIAQDKNVIKDIIDAISIYTTNSADAVITINDCKKVKIDSSIAIVVSDKFIIFSVKQGTTTFNYLDLKKDGKVDRLVSLPYAEQVNVLELLFEPVDSLMSILSTEYIRKPYNYNTLKIYDVSKSRKEVTYITIEEDDVYFDKQPMGDVKDFLFSLKDSYLDALLITYDAIMNNL